MSGEIPPVELGVLGLAKQTSAGAFTAPTNWIEWETLGLDYAEQVTTINVASGSVSGQYAKPYGYKMEGPFSFIPGGSHGAIVAFGALSANSQIAAQTADTTSAGVTTASGFSTLVLTTGGTYGVGDMVTIGTGTTAELRMVYSYTSASKTLVVGELLLNAAAAAGLAVTRGVQISMTTNPNSPALPRFSIEKNNASVWSERWVDVYFDQLDYKQAAGKLDATATIKAQTDGGESAVTTPAPSVGEQADLRDVFTHANMQMIFAGDSIQFSGTPGTFQAGPLNDVTDITLTIKNNLREYWTQGKKIPRLGRGELTVEGTYTIINRGGSATEFRQAINAVAQQTNAMYLQWTQNQATTGTAAMRGFGFYLPKVKITAPKHPQAIGSSLSTQVTFVAEPPSPTASIIQARFVDGVGTAF